MYIGSTGEKGLHHLVYEVVDNSVDEALAGYATRIDVTIHVRQLGHRDRRRPRYSGRHQDDEGKTMPAAQVVLTKLHAGGKFDSNYKVSGGLHGVGVSCVNALCEELRARDLARRLCLGAGVRQGRPHSSCWQMGPARPAKTGTTFTFKPDTTIMDVTEFNYDTLAQRLRELAFLNKGLEIHLTDERTTDQAGESKHQSSSTSAASPNSSSTSTRASRCCTRSRSTSKAERDCNVAMEIALQYNDGYSENDLQLRQQHQHRRWRHAPHRLPHRADPHHQRRRASSWACSRTSRRTSPATTCARVSSRWSA